ncbi:cyclin-like protein [Hyaloraphidium curvatum]|nr:cyclin-like protein [Hyaloraphidium curvatum]
MASYHCRACGPTTAESDEHRGHTVCVRCGQVLEENAIVSEVTFSEKANGAAVADGFFIGADKARATSRLKGVKGISQDSNAESREQTLANGRRRIQQLANALNMSDKYVEAAQRFFNLAIVNNFTRGRKTANVVAACLYIVCRTEKTTHMLIDFSDVLQTDVYVLGSTFLRLVQVLNLRLPLVDPALYMTRFASRLEFGDKTEAVKRDALRLVSRMNRDWIQTGRRPAGICAACLLIAARMHNFKRTQREIVQVVNICDATLRKRLEEFKNTPSAAMSVSDFQNIWLDEQADPPSFSHSKKRKEPELPPIAPESGGQRATAGRNPLPFESTEVQEGDVEQEMLSALHGEDLRRLYPNVEELADDDLTALDDDEEIQGALLEQDEVEFKTIIWTNENKDWLEAQEEKRLQAEADRAAGIEPKPPRQKRRKKANAAGPDGQEEKAGAPVVAPTPAEATKAMLASASKKSSKKINYAVLENLFEVCRPSRVPFRLLIVA